MFAGSRGGPRFLNFLPDDCGINAGKLLVGSGQTFGGFELISPLENVSNTVNGSAFFQPELGAGESMTTVSIHEGELLVGTSYGRVLEYALNSYEKSGYSQRRSRSNDPLDLPPFAPNPSELTIDPYLLCSTRSEVPPGWNVFDSYAMAVDPIVSEDDARFHPRYVNGKVTSSSLGGPMSKKPLVAPPQRWLSKELQGMIFASTDAGGVGKVLPASKLVGLGDLLAEEDQSNTTKKGVSVPNPNKILSSKLFDACYDATADPRKRVQGYQSEKTGEEGHIESEENDIPQRYRMTIRKVANFDYTRYNESGLWVGRFACFDLVFYVLLKMRLTFQSGWDYAPTFSNSFTCAVLSLLYFVEEIRSTALRLQLCGSEMSIPSSGGVSVTAELGCLFHLIESLSSNGMIQPDLDDHKNTGQVKAYFPSKFISAFTKLPEATNLALIDGVAGAAELARRPEAFYRFLMQYLDRELGLITSEPGQNQGLVDSMQGIDFLSIIEYATSRSKVSTSRAFTVDLAYDQRWSKKSTPNIRFGEVLRYSLCKDAPLRAWSDQTRSYESVIQRKIATSLPAVLSLSCCCAGKHADPLGLKLWQQEDKQNWLPEYIEVQIEADRSITVKELATTDDGKEEWLVSQQKLPLPASIFNSIKDEPAQNLPMKKSYRLEASISFVRSVGDSLDAGHHVLHVRVPVEHEIEALSKQLHQVEICLQQKEQARPGTEHDHQQHLSLVSRISPDTLKERKKHLQDQLSRLKGKENYNHVSEWLLINGFVVTKVNPDDVRSFNAKFKEPSIVIFREVSGEKEQILPPNLSNLLSNIGSEISVQTSVMETKSLSEGRHPGIPLQGKYYFDYDYTDNALLLPFPHYC